FSRLFPFLFVDVPSPQAAQPAHEILEAEIDALPLDKKMQLARDARTPLPVLAHLARDPATDVRVLLAQRMGHLATKISAQDSETNALLLAAMRQLAEESVT